MSVTQTDRFATQLDHFGSEYLRHSYVKKYKIESEYFKKVKDFVKDLSKGKFTSRSMESSSAYGAIEKTKRNFQTEI